MTVSDYSYIYINSYCKREILYITLCTLQNTSNREKINCAFQFLQAVYLEERLHAMPCCPWLIGGKDLGLWPSLTNLRMILSLVVNFCHFTLLALPVKFGSCSTVPPIAKLCFTQLQLQLLCESQIWLFLRKRVFGN